MELDFIKTAKEMLRIPDGSLLPEGLAKKLIRVDSLCRIAGGHLVSRQMIAAIIESWENNK